MPRRNDCLPKINQNDPIAIYGIVTTGLIWKFAKLESNTFTKHSLPYAISKPPRIFGILDLIFSECEQQISPPSTEIAMPAPPHNEITQSIQEAEALWKRRQIAIDAPYFTLGDLAYLDSRLNIQLDTLRQNSAQSWATLEQQFNGSQYKLDDLFPATVLAFSETAPQSWRDFLFELIGTDERQITALIATLGWLPLDSLKEYLLQFLEIPNSLHRRIAIATCAHHRADVGDYLTAALQNDAPELRVCALKAAGELGRPDLLPALREHVTAASPDWRFWAAWSAIRMGERGYIVEILSEFALTDSPLRQHALPLIARVLPNPQRQRWLEALKETAANSRDAITSVGAVGEPSQIPWLIEHMQHPDLARAAGEAFTLITGLDLVEHQLAQPTETSPTHPKNPMRSLPYPNPDAIKTWWQANDNRFQRGIRYLLGRPITPDHCLEALVNGYQRQRTAAALELALIQTGMPLFALHAPAAEQQDLLNVQDNLQNYVQTAAQLWLKRDQAAHAPMTTLPELTELDGQLEQQLTLLREAGDLGWKCCWEHLTASTQPGVVFTAVATAASYPDDAPFNQMIGYVETAPDTIHEVIAALGWVAPGVLRGRVRDLLTSNSPLLRYIGIAACSLHQVDPGQHLDAALKNSSLRLRARALRTIGELRVQRHLPTLRQHLNHANEQWRFWAAWSASLLSEYGGLKELQRIIEHSPDPLFQQCAIDMLACAMEPASARIWIKQLLLDERLTPTVIRGLGMLGDPPTIPWLIRRMAGLPEQARLAGEAFSRITGVDLTEQGLIMDPLKEAMKPVKNKAMKGAKPANPESLPCPDPQAVNQWWSQQRHHYKKGRRYLMGFPISIEVCWQVLLHGQQFQRAAAALELALLEPQTALFPIEAPGFRQWEWLSGVRTALTVVSDGDDGRSTIPQLPALKNDLAVEIDQVQPEVSLAARYTQDDQSLVDAIEGLAEFTKPITRGWFFRRRALLESQKEKRAVNMEFGGDLLEKQDNEQRIQLPDPTLITIRTARNILSTKKNSYKIRNIENNDANPNKQKIVIPNRSAFSESKYPRSLVILSPVAFDWYFNKIAEIWQKSYVITTARYSLFNQLLEIDSYLKSYIDYLPKVSDDFWSKIENIPVEKWNAGHLFAASLIALRDYQMQRFLKVINVAIKKPRISQGFVSAFNWLPSPTPMDRVQILLESRYIKWRRLGMMVAITNHIECEDFLLKSINDADQHMQILVIKAAGKLAYKRLMPFLLRNFKSKNDDYRFWSAWSAVLLGERRAALDILKSFALSSMLLRRHQALQLILRVSNAQDIYRWASIVAQHNRRLYSAMVDSGSCKNIFWVPWLIEIMKQPEQTRSAGESFTILTGVDLINEGLIRPKIISSSESESVASMELMQFFLPDSEAISTWWSLNEKSYKKDKNYLLGQEITLESCIQILKNGRQYQRTAAALEIGLLKEDFPLFETQTSSFQQREWINRLQSGNP